MNPLFSSVLDKARVIQGWEELISIRISPLENPSRRPAFTKAHSFKSELEGSMVITESAASATAATLFSATIL